MVSLSHHRKGQTFKHRAGVTCTAQCTVAHRNVVGKEDVRQDKGALQTDDQLEILAVLVFDGWNRFVTGRDAVRVAHRFGNRIGERQMS